MISEEILINNDELDRYEKSVQAMLNGELDSDRFQSIRLQQGIYGQRQEGVNMIRVKIPGGKLTPLQTKKIATLLNLYSSSDTAHITTRQSIQIHHVALNNTPKALRLLAGAGLTTREACNNTVRNISACPLAGVCPAEHTDITPVVEQATTHFLRHPLTQHLPRKFKISISGCEQDCAQGMIHDLAIIAVRENGQYGFRLLAGGGLGHKPHQAVTIDKFVSEEDLLASIEAIINVHNRYSDRRYRAKSRLKFLVDRFGSDELINKYQQELQRTRVATAPQQLTTLSWQHQTKAIHVEPGAPRNPFKQKQPGRYSIPVHINLGNITATQLNGIADLMLRHNLTELRTSQDQNLIISGVAENKINILIEALSAQGLQLPAPGSNVVACPGTSTCRLGITSSQAIAKRLSGGDADLRLRISGCHNGCAQPETGDIGLYGEGRRLLGRLIPHYQLFIGGNTIGGSCQLGLKTRSVPAARVEAAIKLLQQSYEQDCLDNEVFTLWSQRKGAEFFDQLLLPLTTVIESELQTLTQDHGDKEAFQVIQFGGGECAGAAQETVAALFAEATNEANYRNAFLLQRKFTDSIEAAKQVLRLVGQALLFVSAEPALDNIQAICQKLRLSLKNQLTMVISLEQIHTRLTLLETAFDYSQYQALITKIDNWAHSVAVFCQNIDQHLDLAALIPAPDNEKPEGTEHEYETVDLSSFGCPLHYIKARNTLRQHKPGTIINFIFATEELAQQATKSLAADGHNIEKFSDSDISKIRIKISG